VPQGFPSGAAGRSFVVNIDGASRGNPGPAAAGWVIRDAADGQVLIEDGLFLGQETNNRAEYFALLFAIEDALALAAASVKVLTDSELLVRQFRGEYRVKNASLKPLFERARRLAAYFAHVEVAHVPREENRDADRAANAAIDAQVKKS
jgi:ribonuclease HI